MAKYKFINIEGNKIIANCAWTHVSYERVNYWSKNTYRFITSYLKGIASPVCRGSDAWYCEAVDENDKIIRDLGSLHPDVLSKINIPREFMWNKIELNRFRDFIENVWDKKKKWHWLGHPKEIMRGKIDDMR